MRFRGPLANSYWSAVLLVLLALTPYLVLSTALTPLLPLIGPDLGLSERALQLTAGMANAGYAFGAVLAVQLASRLPARRLLVLYAIGFVVASALAAWSPSAPWFVAGHIGQGLGTGLLLIAAVPPLVTSWPASRMPTTAGVMNLGIFGAVALGPVVGGIAAGGGSWRPLLWIFTALAAGALLFALLTYEDRPPQDPSAPVDLVALGLAGAGCAAAFLGVAELVDRRLTDPVVLAPLVAGLAMLVVLLVHQYRTPNPLIPLRQIVHTVPIAGIVTAISAGAASVALVELVQTALHDQGVGPRHVGLLFVPEFASALLAAGLFARLVRTRGVGIMAVGGLTMLAAGAAVLFSTPSGGDAVVLVGTALVGLGVGSSVSPALFLSGFSLRSAILPRVFSLIELLRAVAAFLVGPALVRLAATTGGSPSAGFHSAVVVAGAIAVAGFLVATGVLWLGGWRPQRPRLERWLGGEGPAIDSPPLLARLRRRSASRG
jgi:MFS family permease